MSAAPVGNAGGAPVDQAGRGADPSRLPGAQPQCHRFRVGDIECVALSDGVIPFFGPPGKAAKSLAAPAGTAAPVLVPLACLLIRLPHTGLVLIDTGFGAGATSANEPMRSVGQLNASMECAGVMPQDIDAVLISHIHPDHVGGMFDGDGAQTYPNATYHIGAEELAFWSQEPLDLSRTASPPPAKIRMASAAKRMLALADGRLRVFDAGEQVVQEVGTMLLPGHSPGQVGFTLSSGSKKLLYTADAMSDPRESIEAPEVPNPMDMDPDMAVKTRHKLIGLLSEPSWQAFVPHFPWPNIGRVVSNGGRAVWEPAVDLR